MPKSEPKGQDDGWQVNIPAPPTFKPNLPATNGAKRANLFVPQGDVEATAEADPLKAQPRKAPVYTKVPVP